MANQVTTSAKLRTEDATLNAGNDVLITGGATRKLSGQVFHTVVGMALLQALSFVSGVLIARQLAPEQQGKFQLIIAVTTFTAMFAKLGLDEGLTYLIPRYVVKHSDKVSSLIAYSIGATFLLSIALGIFFYSASDELEKYVFKLPGVSQDLKFTLWLLPSTMLLLMGMAVFRGLGRSDLRAYVYYYAVGFSFFAAVAIFSLTGMSTTEAYIARAGSFVLGALLALGLIARSVRFRAWNLSVGEIREMHMFAGLLIFVGLFQYVVEQPLVDLIIVSRVAPAHEVGVYSVAARVGALVAIIANAMTVVCAPAFAKAAGARDLARLKAQYLRASEWMARLSLLAGAGLFLLSREALTLFGSAYQSGETLLAVFLGGQIIVGLLGLNTPLLLASGYTKVEFWLTGIFAVMMIASGALLGTLYGSIGVAIATASSFVLLAVARRIACAVIFDLRLDRQIIQVSAIGAAACSLSILARETIPLGGIANSLSAVIVMAAAFCALSFASGARISFLRWKLNASESESNS